MLVHSSAIKYTHAHMHTYKHTALQQHFSVMSWSLYYWKIKLSTAWPILFLFHSRSSRLSGPKHILLQLCIALSATLVLVTVAVAPSDSETSCIVAALLLHVFLLALFMWMLFEGVSMYNRLVQIVSGHSMSLPVAIATGWGKGL